MAIKIFGQHMDIGESFSTYILESIDKAIVKYFNESYGGQVHVTKGKNYYCADCTIYLKKHTYCKQPQKHLRRKPLLIKH